MAEKFVVLKRYDSTRHRLYPDTVLDASEFEPGEVEGLMDLGVLDVVPPDEALPEEEPAPSEADPPQPAAPEEAPPPPLT